jgi:hypothetical protein
MEIKGSGGSDDHMIHFLVPQAALLPNISSIYYFKSFILQTHMPILLKFIGGRTESNEVCHVILKDAKVKATNHLTSTYVYLSEARLFFLMLCT